MMERDMKILIVDDTPKWLGHVTNLVQDCGHEAVTATGGHQALEFLKERKDIAAVITDVQMPLGNGIELLRSTYETLTKTIPFYVHSSASEFNWDGDKIWNLPVEIPKTFKFAQFHLKKMNWEDEVEKFLNNIHA